MDDALPGGSLAAAWETSLSLGRVQVSVKETFQEGGGALARSCVEFGTRARVLSRPHRAGGASRKMIVFGVGVVGVESISRGGSISCLE